MNARRIRCPAGRKPVGEVGRADCELRRSFNLPGRWKGLSHTLSRMGKTSPRWGEVLGYSVAGSGSGIWLTFA